MSEKKDDYKVPDGWCEVFPLSPLNWRVYDIKDEYGNLDIGSRKIEFDKNNVGHCLIKNTGV